MRARGNAYLSCKDENVKRQSKVRAPDAADGLEGDLVGGVAVVGPGLAEADVGEADGAPGEQSGQRRQREEPVEHNLALRVKVDVGQQTKDENDAHRVEGTAGAVDVGEDLGGVALLRKGSEGTGATVDSRHSDGKNRHENGNVHEVIESLEAGVLADEDKGRGVHIVGRGSEKVGVTSVDEETDEEETEDVKAAWVVSLMFVTGDGGCFKGRYSQCDTPEDLLDSTRHLLDGVARLSSGQTNQLGSAESKSRRDKHAAETAEAVLEWARVHPQAGTPVFVVATILGTTAEDEDEGDDEEDAGGEQLECRRCELLLCVTKRSKDVDDEDGKPEHRDPHADADTIVPVGYGDTADRQFQGQDDCPLENVVPTHGKTPRRVDEASRVSVEATGDRVHDGEFTKGVDDVEHHDTDDEEVDEERSRALSWE